MNTVKKFEDFTSTSSKTEIQYDLEDAISTALFNYARKNDSIPCSHYGFDNPSPCIMIPFYDLDSQEFYFTIKTKNGNNKDFEGKKIILSDITINVPLNKNPMNVVFGGHAEEYDDEGYFTFDEIIEKQEIIDFIKEEEPSKK